MASHAPHARGRSQGAGPTSAGPTDAGPTDAGPTRAGEAGGPGQPDVRDTGVDGSAESGPDRPEALPGPVGRAVDLLDRALVGVCGVLLTVVTAAVFWQVLARYVTASASAWANELATMAFVWLALLAVALGVRRGRHLVLDVWELLPLPRWVGAVLDTVAAVITVGVLLALAYYGYTGLSTSFTRTLPGLGISFGWNALAVPVATAVAVVFALEAWWRGVRRTRGHGEQEPRTTDEEV
ncbi:TRAP transporter small permease [Pseudokineococcus sp. 1T1Z-3]|uniref:TRAP transporter small permease n=1 Tax=Pseudokineococcus sp. 1T1Z-3 TaxID=3132745 RepID=UPI003095969D